MAYEYRMYARPLAPCMVPVATACLIAFVLTTIVELPGRMGGPVIETNLPDWIAGAGSLLSLVAIAWQNMRIWRWSRGETSQCWICGCLLGPEREGLRGIQRRCLGCGAKH